MDISLPGGRLLVSGKIDRIDEGEDGTFHVWDYKTGSPYSVQEGRGLAGGARRSPRSTRWPWTQLLDRSGRPGLVRCRLLLPGVRGEGQRIAVRSTPQRRAMRSDGCSIWPAAGLFHARLEGRLPLSEFRRGVRRRRGGRGASKEKLCAAADDALVAGLPGAGMKNDA